ncbi:hypothetical protein EYR38_003002 [Pleurotus pulmonarius]|nr:hypothetical protein EYR38_003002 [Pleurotus pulmonarius]
MTDPRSDAIGIIGAGAAGLITAYTLLQDGFKDIQLLTRDKTAGGIWAEERVYPGLTINNVYGEFQFSPLSMPETSGRPTGEDMRSYMSTFADQFLKDRIRYDTEVLNIKRNNSSDGWLVEIEDKRSRTRQVLRYAKIVLCTGGCSSPLMPDEISSATAKSSGFNGLVIHSSQFRSRMDDLLSIVKPVGANSPDSAGRIVIVGGGKSAQDIAAYLTNEGRKVSVVFERADAVLGVTSPLPDFIRRSRFLGIMSPHSELKTRLERFLHTTWLGSKIVHFVWNTITSTSFDALRIPKDSPLRHAHSLFWGIRTNDEGVLRPNGFHSLVADGKIELVAPARVTGYGKDGRSVKLSDGRTLDAAAVILGTGFTSSWEGLLSEKTADELGLSRHAPADVQTNQWDNYQSLRDPPSFQATSKQQQWASSIYRGLVPYKNIGRRDFAINGAIFTTNNGYAFETFSHWISAYFLGDKMRLPATPEEAFAATERNAEWLRKRFPGMLLWTNESYSSNLAFFTWPQVADEILEDLELPSLRSATKVAELDPSTSSHEPSVVEHLPIELIRLIIDSIDDQDDKDKKRDSDEDECASECSEEDYSTNKRPSSAIHRPPSLAPVCRSLLAAPLLQELLLAGLVFRRGSVDLIDFLSIPSATLEKLTLLSILSPEEERTTAERTVVRMDRLRTIQFLETTHDVLRQHHIECPHLRSVFVQLRSDKPWLPPPWIPHGLSEIIIRLPTDRPVPEFGNYIRPSDMTIDVFEDYSYSRSLDWVQCCINHLPFPEQLIRLTINITVDLRYAPVTYSPDPVDYQKLCDALQILYKHGSLQYVNLGLTIGGNGRAEDAFIQANEVQKLKETFAALFDASVLAAKLVFIRLRGFRESVLFTTTLY